MNKRKYKKRTPEQLAKRRDQARLRGPRNRSGETPEKTKAQKQRFCERVYGGDWAQLSRANRKRRAEIAGREYQVRGTIDDIKKRVAVKRLITLLKRRARTLQRVVLTVEQIEQRRLDRNAATRRKYAHNAKYAIYHRIKRNIHKHLRDGQSSRLWSQRLGYTMAQLHAHLERQFIDGMTWQNKGRWHIDHIRPVSSFTFTSVDDAQFRECYCLSNLRPMWGAENVRKNDKRVYLL